ncbi:MAG: BNR-4 repeat-containing protein [Opitutales bacterium]|nr:BNR-4 repeat-containing protein [Opitutales bacterium]
MKFLLLPTPFLRRATALAVCFTLAPFLTAGLFTHADLLPSFGDGSLTNAGYSFQDRQPLASFADETGTLWQVVGYISLNRLPVIQWRKRQAEAPEWSLWARLGPDAAILPAPGSNWHGYMSVAIDTAGYAHFICDGRGGSEGFRYHRSDLPVQAGWTGGLINRSANGLPGWSSQTNSTYWRFSKHPQTGRLTLALRRSGGGHSIFVLNADSQTWSAFPGTRNSDGRLFHDSGIFAQYVAQDVVFRGDDLYVGYVHRITGTATTNEDLSVIKFDGTANRWQRLDGTPLSTPVTPFSGTVVDPSKTGSMLDHRWDMMADGAGHIHGFYRRLDESGFLQIHHFWIDENDTVHGPAPITDTRYTQFWQDAATSRANLSQARSFYIADRVYVAWQEQAFGNRTVAAAARYPFTEWTAPVVIDETDLLASDPEFERGAWDTRNEIWLAAMPFRQNTPAGRPVSVSHIRFNTLPVPADAPTTYTTWILGFEGLHAPARAPSANPSRDGLPNLLKYALGIDPREPAPPSGKLPFVTSHNGSPVFHYFHDTRLPDIAYHVEWSADLATWQRDGLTVTILEPHDGREHRQVRPIIPAHPLFFRLSVEPRPPQTDPAPLTINVSPETFTPTPPRA